MLNIQSSANKVLPVMAEIVRRTIPPTLFSAAVIPLSFLIGGLGSLDPLKKAYEDIKKMDMFAISAFAMLPAVAAIGTVTSYMAYPLVEKQGAQFLTHLAAAAALGQFILAMNAFNWKPVITFNAVYFAGAAVIISTNHEAIAAYLAKQI